jgi:hypothetical protein
MMKATVFLALLFALQGKPNPDFKYDEKAGVSMQKFPKNDEWDFKDMGRYFKSPKITVASKVDELSIELLQFPPATGTSVYDIKKQVEGDYAQLSGNKDLTDCKQVAMNPSKLPGGGGGGVNGMFYQATFKAQDKPMEMREWTWIGRENQCLYVVIVFCDEGMYKKHQKIVDFILASIKTYKLPK